MVKVQMDREYLIGALLALIIVCTTILCLYDKLDVESVKSIFLAIIPLLAGWAGIKLGFKLSTRMKK